MNTALGAVVVVAVLVALVLAVSYRRAAAMCGPLAVVVDVTGPDFCDPLGQRALLRYHGFGATRVGAPPCLQRLFGRSSQQHLFRIDPSLPWPVAPFRVFEAASGTAPRIRPHGHARVSRSSRGVTSAGDARRPR